MHLQYHFPHQPEIQIINTRVAKHKQTYVCVYKMKPMVFGTTLGSSYDCTCEHVSQTGGLNSGHQFAQVGIGTQHVSNSADRGRQNLADTVNDAIFHDLVLECHSSAFDRQSL